MDSIFRNSQYKGQNPVDILKSISEITTVNNGEKIITTYKTPYGVSFTDNMAPFLWMYNYDDDIGFIRDENSKTGVIESGDIVLILEILKSNPNKLRTKPESILYLEKLTGEVAYRKCNYFGGWHLTSKKYKYSLFNNPFGITTCYTNNENNFEVYFWGQENDVREYQSVRQIEDAMKNYKYITP